MTRLPQLQPESTHPMTRRKILCFALPGVHSVDVCGPMEVFASANLFLPQGMPTYELHMASLDGAAITTQAGLRIAVDYSLYQLNQEFDSLLICGGAAEAMQNMIQGGEFRTWLQQAQPNFKRIVSICSGALLLAATGLLDQKRATTHWRLAQLMQTLFPQVEVDADAIYISQHPFYTSAGVSSGIDLALSLVEQDCGASVSQAVARDMVLYLRRSGGQNQYSQGLQLQFQHQPQIQQLVSEIWEHPEHDHSVAKLAEKLCMSERNFSRWFKQQTRQTPAQLVWQARFERAKYLLCSSDYPLQRVAELSGFGSSDAMQRRFQKHLGVSAGQFRQHFQTAS